MALLSGWGSVLSTSTATGSDSCSKRSLAGATFNLLDKPSVSSLQAGQLPPQVQPGLRWTTVEASEVTGVTLGLRAGNALVE
jgi:hypothetical protein